MPVRTTTIARLAALALAASGPGCLARPSHLRTLERDGVRVVGVTALDAEEVARGIDCTGQGTSEVRCTYVRAWAAYDRRGRPATSFALRRAPDPLGRPRHEIVVSEGPSLTVSRVTAEGLEPFAAAQDWIAALPLLAGGPFSLQALHALPDELGAALRGAGRPSPQVFPRAYPDPQRPEVAVTLYVDPGPPGEAYRFGPILAAVPPGDPERARLVAEVEAFARRGEPFDLARVAAARRRLGAYPAAELVVSKPDDERREIPLVVRRRP